MMGRNAQTTLAGQSRLATTLGINDPRHRRRSQGFSGNQDFYVGYGLRKDSKGRLEVDVEQIAGAICLICSDPPPPPPSPPCDPLVDPCGCCPVGLVCNPSTLLCEDLGGNCAPKSPIVSYCRSLGLLCQNGRCEVADSAPSGGCGCGGDCDALAIAWLGF